MHATNLAELVHRARGGDQHAWARLVRQFEPLVRAALRPYRLGHAEASDAVQDIWLALLENLRTLRDADRLPGWLHTTTRRRAYRLVAASRRELPLGDHPHATGDDPEQHALTAERAELLWRQVRALPARERLMLTLIAHYPELTGAQLAAALGVSANSVSSLKTRCFTQLRRRLSAQGVSPGGAAG